MSDENHNEIKHMKSGTVCFGGEPPVKSPEKIQFPCYVRGKRLTMVADVVDRDIPLLISKPEMKARGFVLDFNDETLTADEISHVLKTTTAGHFKIPLWKDEEVNVCITEMEKDEQRKVLTKLHRQFRQNSAKATEDLLQNAGLLNDEIWKINKDVVASCEICQQ